MQRQLTLIDESPEWRLDEHTREVGMQGVARAREALAAAHRFTPAPAGPTAAPKRHRLDQHRSAA